MSHRKLMLAIIATTLTLTAFCGWLFAVAEHIPLWHGLYVELANAVTFGGDVSPTGWGYAINAVVCLLVIPLFGASFSLFTSLLTEARIREPAKAIAAARRIIADLFEHQTGTTHTDAPENP